MVTGITFTQDAKVIIDLKKYGNYLRELFIETGTIDEAEQIMYKPNAKTRKAIRDAEKGVGLTTFKTKEELFDFLDHV